MIVKCKKCGTEYDCDETYRGKSFRCSCGQEVSVAYFAAPPVARRKPAPQNVTVVVSQPQKESNPFGLIGLLCVLASIPLSVVLPPVGVVAGVVGFLCCLIGLFFRPRGAAGCGLLICAIPYMILAGIIGALAPSVDDIRDKIKENEKSRETEAEKREASATKEQKKGESTMLVPVDIKTKILLKNAKFSIDRSSFSPQPIFEFSVENKTDHAVSSIEVDAVLRSPGRKIPWAKDGFRHKIPGGLNPGEEREFCLGIGMFSEWAKLDDRSDYVLDLSLDVARDENGEAILLFEKRTAPSAVKVTSKGSEISKSDFINICRWRYTWPRHVALLADKKGVTLLGGGKADIAKGVNFRLEDVFRDGRLKLKLGEAEKFFIVDHKETNFSEIYEMPPKS